MFVYCIDKMGEGRGECYRQVLMLCTSLQALQGQACLLLCLYSTLHNRAMSSVGFFSDSSFSRAQNCITHSKLVNIGSTDCGTLRERGEVKSRQTKNPDSVFY